MGIGSSTDSKGWEYVKCSKCKKNNAVYRAKGSPIQKNVYTEAFWSCTVNTDEHRFTACSKCATDYVKRFFTHVPDGWKENIMYAQEYEYLIKLH